jgi:uncharacterized membrane protein
MMKLSEKVKTWQFSGNRLEAFNDAVFAIVMTLLILELKVPHFPENATNDEVLQSVLKVAPVFFSWAISFFFIAIIWLHHHNIMHMSSGSDYGTIWINFFLLFFICLLPFPTAMMGEFHTKPLLVMLWGFTVSATCVMLVWFYYYQVKNYLTHKYDRKTTMRNVRLSILAGPLLYFIAGLLAWVSIYISFAIYTLVPLLYIFPLDKEIRTKS